MNVDEVLFLARWYHREKKYDLSEYSYQEILKMYPNNSIAYYELGNVYRDKAELKEAVFCYSKAIEFNPRFADAYLALGDIFFYSGANTEKGMDYFQLALKYNPHFIELFKKRGIYILDKNQIKKMKETGQHISQVEYIIASYPRSGNHWVRYIIEWFSKRPTLGEGDMIWSHSYDLPIHKGLDITDTGSIEINFSAPIAIKRHTIRYSDNRNLGLILIARNFNECIIREIRDPNTGLIPWDRVDAEISKYVKLFYDFELWNGKKIVIYYEDLLKNYKNSICTLLRFARLFNNEKFADFIHNYDYHKNASISYYDKKGGSQTKGDKINYHRKFIPLEKKLLIQNTLIEEHNEIFKKYLTIFCQ